VSPETRRLILSAHTIDLIVRKDAKEYRLEGDFVKELLCRLTVGGKVFDHPFENSAGNDLCTRELSPGRFCYRTRPEHER
jgi:hypothetical protein